MLFRSTMVGWIEDACRAADTDKDAALSIHKRVPPARILVTGASGFLGSALLARLTAQGESIRVLARRPSSQFDKFPGVQVVYGDLGDPDAVDRAVDGVEVVYHVGATMRGRGWGDFQSGTIEATKNVVESCLRHRVGRLVYVSSLTVLDYATHASGTVVREDARLEPFPERRGAYTQAKLQAETLEECHSRARAPCRDRPARSDLRSRRGIRRALRDDRAWRALGGDRLRQTAMSARVC